MGMSIVLSPKKHCGGMYKDSEVSRRHHPVMIAARGCLTSEKDQEEIRLVLAWRV